MPANSEASFSQPATESLYCELAVSAVWLRSLRRTLLLWRSRHSCVRSLFTRSSSLAWAHRPYHNQLPSETTAYVAAVTPLLDNEQGEHAAVDGRRALPWRGAPLLLRGCLLSGRAQRDGHSVCIRGAATRHDAKTFGFATKGSSLTRQEFAEERDINVLMAFGRCLRPALYSSLRSSPSHPTGVSALRVTIAIANARFVANSGGFAGQLPSRAGSFAMNRPPADVFGQALLENPPHDSNCILSQIAASTESLLAWQLGRGNQRPRTARTAREKRRLRSGACG